MIFHITDKHAWEKSKETGEYRGGTLETQGFIHCSTLEQIYEVACYLFSKKTNLVILEIDEEEVTPEIKYEDAGNGKLYPHIYGPLNIEAVKNTRDFYIG